MTNSFVDGFLAALHDINSSEAGYYCALFLLFIIGYGLFGVIGYYIFSLTDKMREDHDQ